MSSFKAKEFLFESPLYLGFVIPEEEEEEEDDDFDEFSMLFMKNVSFSIEGYNSFKNTQTTFSVRKPLGGLDRVVTNSNISTLYHVGGVGVLELECKRYHNIYYFFITWDVKNRVATKIGQYPSMADAEMDVVKKYRGVLGKDKSKEFVRAIRLASSGVGVGSYVYLRRLFEFVILDTFEKNETDLKITKSDFLFMKMEDKIKEVRKYLPKFLVDNRQLYSILSLGIHELDEAMCLAYFDVVKKGIELILDQKLEQESRLKSEKEGAEDIKKLNLLLKGMN